MGGVVSTPAYYCPHDITGDKLQEIQASIPVYKLYWENLQAASTSRRSTYGFQMGKSIWIYEKLNDPKETLYHEYGHIYEAYYMGKNNGDPHADWHTSAPHEYNNIYSQVELENVSWM